MVEHRDRRRTRAVVVVGIGPGDPDLVTHEALAAIGEVDVVLGFDKGERTRELRDVRQAVLERARGGRSCRVVEIRDARRSDAVSYPEAVRRWHGSRADSMERALVEEVADGEVVGILVWGDPSLYDSTLRVLDEVHARGRVAVDVRVVAGISSLALLAARHRIPLHAVGGAVLVTTGRRLALGLPDGVDDVVVFLDAECGFTRFRGEGWDLYWGAFLGMPDEELLAGPVDQVADLVVRRRSELRTRHGWVFDLYLLRRQ